MCNGMCFDTFWIEQVLFLYRNKPGIFSKLPLELEFKGTMELTDFLSSVYISSPYGNEKHECSTVLASLSVNVIMASQGTVCEYNIAFELFIRFYFVLFFFNILYMYVVINTSFLVNQLQILLSKTI